MAEKGGPLSSEKALLIPSRQQQLSQRFQKMPNNVFSCQHYQKRPKKCQTMTYMPNTIFSCQTTSKKAKFLEFGVKSANLATLFTTSRCHGPLTVQSSGSPLKVLKQSANNFFTGDHGRPQKISRRGGKVDILLIFFWLLTMQRKLTYTRIQKRKCPMLRQQLHTVLSL